MSEEEQSCETPLDDLMESDLKHYEEASSAIHCWSNQIPQAINFWYKGKLELEIQNDRMMNLLKNTLKVRI